MLVNAEPGPERKWGVPATSGENIFGWPEAESADKTNDFQLGGGPGRDRTADLSGVNGMLSR
jgi:hypothetical protein